MSRLPCLRRCKWKYCDSLGSPETWKKLCMKRSLRGRGVLTCLVTWRKLCVVTVWLKRCYLVKVPCKDKLAFTVFLFSAQMIFFLSHTAHVQSSLHSTSTCAHSISLLSRALPRTFTHSPVCSGADILKPNRCLSRCIKQNLQRQDNTYWDLFWQQPSWMLLVSKLTYFTFYAQGI